MNRANPHASHVAVQDGRVIAVGTLEEVSAWGPHTLDTRFANHVLLPGFVEGHAHLLAGGIWRYSYVGHHERTAPDGVHWSGLSETSALLERLQAQERQLADDEPLVAWGFDPIFLNDERLNKHHLDRVSKTRPIAVIHSNFHLMTVNSAALTLAQYDERTNIEGVAKDNDGVLNGELQEFAAMFPIMRRLKIDFESMARTGSGIQDYAQVAKRAGVTTATDLFNDLSDDDVALLTQHTNSADYATRLVPVLNAHSGSPPDIAKRANELKAMSTDKMRLGAAKMITDGSIQGFTARMRWPGYFKGPDHGIWNIAPEQIMDMVNHLNAAAVQMHIHVNGDEASEVVIDALARALDNSPRHDHRHTLQHCQLADAAQFRRIAALGACVNLFANHIYYFGDQHYAMTVGPERAMRMNACRTALDNGIPLAIHSDAPVTPMGPLFTAWCAVNRVTPSGRVLGAHERITLPEALEAITIGAARTLHLDKEIGSIEVGKKADFAVLDANPFDTPESALKDIGVWGTVFAGVPQPV